MKTKNTPLIAGIILILIGIPLVLGLIYNVKTISIVFKVHPNYYQDYSDVLLVCNPASANSLAICTYFTDQRTAYKFDPSNQVDLVDVSTSETITDAEYDKIKLQIRAWLDNNPSKEINYIVTTKGVPLRTGAGKNCGYNTTSGAPWSSGFCKSVDSKLFYELGLNTTFDMGYTAFLNPYFGDKQKFRHEDYGGYLITRLDGVNLQEIKQLIDSSTLAQANGLNGTYLINCYGSYGDYYGYCNSANNMLLSKGKTVEYNTTDFVRGRRDLAGYVSYGSNACGNTNCSNSTAWNLSFNPGALTETFVSTSGRTLNSYWSGSGQSLITDLIKSNVTGIKGYVYEPYLTACANPNYLWDRYTAGYNLADSYYIASRYSSWMDVVIGDPKTFIVRS